MRKLWHRIWIGIAWRVAMPLAWLWVCRHQRRILQRGRALDEDELALAARLGIDRRDEIRVWSVERVPAPGGFLHGLGRLAGLSTHGAKGMALDHGIYLEAAQAARRSLLAHELVHVAQYERLGGPRAFLREYLRQCLSEGYWSAPLEIEARERAEEHGRSHSD